MALLFYRILQLKLDNKYPIHQIKEDLAEVSVVSLEQNIFMTINQGCVFEALMGLNDKPLLSDYVKLEELRKALKELSN